MSSPLDALPQTEVGERLRLTREAAKITQAQAAETIGVARTTLVAIEGGQRRVRLSEIQKLAKLYNTSVNAIFRQGALKTNFAPRFRKLVSVEDDDAESAGKLLASLVEAEVELENLLGATKSRNDPPERPLLRGNVTAQAEHDALELRQWLGLGSSPVQDMVTLLEMGLGVRVYVRRLSGKISGLFAYDEAVGACILLNANHRRERRAFTAAHELGHFISTRQEPEVLHLGDSETSREERYANAFARAFLTPPRAVMQKFREVTAGASNLNRRHVILLAHFFGVSREAMVLRLEELELARAGTWDWFKENGGITDEHARQVLGDLAGGIKESQDVDQPMGLRIMALAAEAHRRELLSEGQLVRLLQLDRVTFRQFVDDLEIEGNVAHGGPDLSD